MKLPLKRFIDIFGSFTVLLVTAPIMGLEAFAILAMMGRPVLFRQRRPGLDGRIFTLLKFRTMCADRERECQSQFDAHRVTPLGRLLRRTSLDELPQLFNVLRGEMSLVGPRPHALGSQAGEKLFWEIDDRYWERHALKPGLTGLAQIRGHRGATEHEEDLARRLESDLEYLDGWLRLVIRR